MVKNPAAFDAVAAAKRKYDAQVVQIEATAKAQRNAAKAPVLAAIREAINAGNSVSSVAVKGMGYAVPGATALKAFVGAASTSKDDLLSAMGIQAATVGPESLPTVDVATYTFKKRVQNPNFPSPDSFRVSGNGISNEAMVFTDYMGDGYVTYIQVNRDYPDHAEGIRRDFYNEFKDVYKFHDEDIFE